MSRWTLLLSAESTWRTYKVGRCRCVFQGESECRCVTVRVDSNATLPPQIPHRAKTAMAQSLHFDCNRDSSCGAYASKTGVILSQKRKTVHSSPESNAVFFLFEHASETFQRSFLELWGQTQMVTMVPHSYPRPRNRNEKKTAIYPCLQTLNACHHCYKRAVKAVFLFPL